MPGPWSGAAMGTLGVGAFVAAANRFMTFETATLGIYELPDTVVPLVNTIRKTKVVQAVDTMSSNQAVDFGFQPDEEGLVGNEYTLAWEAMSETVFNALKLYYESAETITWDPKERARVNGEKYLIVIRSFQHEVDHRTSTYLMNVEMVINVRGIA